MVHLLNYCTLFEMFLTNKCKVFIFINRLEEGGIITDCSLRTMEVFDILDFSIPAESATSKIILRSSDFKDMLNDIDNSSDYVEFTFSQDPEFFKILTSGIAGKCSVSSP